ncbi:hypothetical protein LTS18_001440, partial [Coniosporium uncinatum]
ILELKGIRKQDQSGLVDLFTAFCNSPSNANLAQNNAMLTNLHLNEPAHAGAAKDGTGTPSLTGGRFDPTAFGSVLMNVAREGVDRFGSPAIGSGIRSEATSPPPGATETTTTSNLNENLKKMGSFFRRDASSGFGAF